MIGSLFSGIGGLDLGLERAGLGPVAWQCEIEPAARAVLRARWPGVTLYNDVREVGHGAQAVDIICGGFPCQDISLAGKGAGLAGARSGLWFEFARIIRELRPRFVVIENVPALLTRGLDRVLCDLAEGGYDALWLPIRASDVGAPHRRERIFIVAWRADMGPERVSNANGGGVRQFAKRIEDRSRPSDERDAFAVDVRAGHLGDTLRPGRGSEGREGAGAHEGRLQSEGGRGGVADADRTGLEERRSVGGDDGPQFATAERGGCECVADGESQRREQGGPELAGRIGLAASIERGGGFALADGDGPGLGGLTSCGAGAREPSRNDIDRCDARMADGTQGRVGDWHRDRPDHDTWPPGPKDTEGWARYLARFPGSEPAIRRETHGVSRGYRGGVDRRTNRRERLKMLGNGVVPYCAEAVGLIIRGMKDHSPC